MITPGSERFKVFCSSPCLSALLCLFVSFHVMSLVLQLKQGNIPLLGSLYMIPLFEEVKDTVCNLVIQSIVMLAKYDHGMLRLFTVHYFSVGFLRLICFDCTAITLVCNSKRNLGRVLKLHNVP